MLPVINKVGGSVDRVNGQLDKVDKITDSAVDAADSVDTAVRAVSMAVTRPVQKLSGLAAAVELRRLGLQDAPRLASRRADRQGGRRPPRARARRRAARRGRRRMSDEITLVVPRAGGLPADRASRPRRPRRRALDLTYEDLDDLQMALDALLGCRDDAGDMHVRSTCTTDSVRSTVGPFAEAQLDELERDSTRARASPRARDRRRRLRGRAARRRRVGRVHEAHERDGGGGELMPRINDKILLRNYHEEGDLARASS